MYIIKKNVSYFLWSGEDIFKFYVVCYLYNIDVLASVPVGIIKNLKAMRSLGILLITILLLWGVVSFVTYLPDPRDWETLGRALFVFSAIAVAALFEAVEEDKEDDK